MGSINTLLLGDTDICSSNDSSTRVLTYEMNLWLVHCSLSYPSLALVLVIKHHLVSHSNNNPTYTLFLSDMGSNLEKVSYFIHPHNSLTTHQSLNIPILSSPTLSPTDSVPTGGRP